MNLIEIGLTRSVVGLGLIVVAGCATAPPPTYPTSPPPLSASSPEAPAPGSDSTTAVIKVPADARELSSGDYPPPGFSPRRINQALLMVVDLDGDPTTAVASTAVTGMDAGKQMSITDVANMSVTMNKLHKYRIVFVPSKPKM